MLGTKCSKGAIRTPTSFGPSNRWPISCQSWPVMGISWQWFHERPRFGLDNGLYLTSQATAIGYTAGVLGNAAILAFFLFCPLICLLAYNGTCCQCVENCSMKETAGVVILFSVSLANSKQTRRRLGTSALACKRPICGKAARQTLLSVPFHSYNNLKSLNRFFVPCLRREFRACGFK